VHSIQTEQDKIACITYIHNTCTPRPCFRPTSFTPFCSNAPYEFVPLLYLHPHFWFDALWLVYLHLFIFFATIFLIYAHIPGTQLEYETRPLCTWILNVTALVNCVA